MVTGEKVFELAMVLIDEVTDNGSINLADTLYYKGKSPSILTTLQTELLPQTVDPVVITDLTDPLLLDDRTCLLILPYGLAAHLLLQEDVNAASFFNSRYDELKRKRTTSIQTTVDKYNVVGELM